MRKGTGKRWALCFSYFFLIVFVNFSQNARASESPQDYSSTNIAAPSLDDSVEDSSQPNLPPATQDASKSKDEIYEPYASNASQKITSNPNDYHSFGLKAAINVEPSSGSAITSMPIIAPSGRAGVEPSPSFLYSSLLPNGILGMGWDFETGYIQRSTKKGVPKYNSSDNFLLVQAGSSQELVFDSAAGFYRAKAEGAFMKMEFSLDQWILTDKKGMRYFFGQDGNSRQYKPGDSSQIFKWCLNRVEDLNGNYMAVSYVKDGNQIYPNEISYTGNASAPLAPFASVKFEYEPRPDESTNYIPGFKVTTSQRLKAIDVKADGNRLRKYQLEYTQSPITKKSLLTSVKQYGQDGATALPSLDFSYQANTSPTFGITTINNAPEAGDNIWAERFASGFDRGHDNFGAVPPPGFNISWGPVSAQSSGNGTCGSWNTDSNGRLNFGSGPDCANWFWTFLYVDSATTWQGPYSGNCVDGTWINGNYETQAGHTWNLRQGYNLVELTAYHQHEGCGIDIGAGPASGVEIMNSTQKFYPQLSGDFNGDGFTDMAVYYEAAGRVKVALSNGTTFLPASTWINNFNPNGKIFLGDFNSDGLTDICSFDEPNGHWKVALSNGTQLTDNGTWLSSFGAGGQPTSGDFNGDGLTDIAAFDKTGGDYQARIALNTGTSFTVSGAAPVVGGATSFPFAADFNGDGLSDFGCILRDSGNWYIRLNTGVLSGEFDITILVNGFGAGKNPAIADFNSDGLTDIGYFEDTTGKVKYRIATGNAFNDAVGELPFNFSSAFRTASVNIQSADYNGDGLTDFTAYNGIDSLEVARSSGKASDILSSIDNNTGGVTTVEYIPSTSYVNTFLPFVIQSVKSTTVNDNLGHSYQTRYAYAGGFWNGAQREFRGFKVVKVADPDGNYSETRFLQDDIYKGRVEKQETHDAAGNLYAKTLNTWNVQAVGGGATFVFLETKDDFAFDAGGAGKRTQEKYFYGESPQLGNLTKAIQLGEVDLNSGADITGDTRTVETEYLNNTSSNNWLIGVPKHSVAKDNDGNIISQSWLYYDGHESVDDAPVKGFLTKKKDWGGDGANTVHPTVRYVYDSYGNVVETIDPNNNSASVSYDSTYHMFPLSAANALGHEVVNEYYGINGVALDSGDGYRGLWGQLKSTTDPNNQKGKRSYDIFGRAVAMVSPLDSISFPTTTTEYEFAGNYVKVKTHQREKSGKAGTIDAVQFYDGLGRLIQTKSESAKPSQFIVSGQTEYNSRGLPEKKYIPFFSSNSIDTIDTIDTARPFSTISYDAMGRAIQSTNPDGTYSTVNYEIGATTGIDENGHKQKSYSDIYGRLIKKEEYLGADGRSPYYPSEAYTLYASTRYEYDNAGNLKKVIDAHNNITTISYDILGRKTSMNDPDMGIWQYGYDILGNLSYQIDAKGQRIDFTYDALNRLTNKTDNATLNADYTYDEPVVTNAKGRLTKANYAAGDNTQFRYDVMGRENKSSKKIDNLEYDVERNYDALNRLASLSFPDQAKAVYAYNAAGQIKSVSSQPPDFVEDTHTKLLLHFDGSDGSSDFTDVSPSDHTVTANGNAQIDTAKKRLGTASGLFDGNGDYLSIPDSDDFNFGAGDWTIDFWCRHTGAGGWWLEQFANINNFIRFGFTGGSQFVFQVKSAGSDLVNVTLGHEITLSANTWHHMAIVRNGDLFTIYRDGENIASATASITMPDLAASLYVGYSRQSGTYWNGWVDEFRISKGIALYTSNFTPPGTTEDVYTKLMIHGDGSDGSTDFTDGSPSEHAVTANGNVQLDTAKKRLGTASGLFDGDGDYLSIPDSDDWNFGTGDWTIDFQMRINAMPASSAAIYHQSTDNDNYIEFYITDSGRIGVHSYVSAVLVASYVTPNSILTTATWHHASFVRNGSNFYIFVDGVSQSLTAGQVIGTSALPDLTGGIVIGARSNFSQGYNGWLDEFRVSKGIARWTADFTPPASAHSVGDKNDDTIKNSGDSVRLRKDNLWETLKNTLNDIYHAGAEIGLWGVKEAYAAQDALVSSGGSTEVLTPPVFSLGTPVLNPTTAGNGRVSLSWNAVAGAAGYKISYGTKSRSYRKTVYVNNATRHWVTGLSNNVKHYFVVQAYNSSGVESGFSNEVNATPREAVPLAPILNAPVAGNGKVDLNWQMFLATSAFSLNSDSTSSAQNYKIKYGTTAGVYTTTIDAGSATTYSVEELTNGQRYYFVVTASNTGGESVNSNEVNAMPVAPAPVATVLNEPVIGDASVVLNWNSVTGAAGYKIKYGTASGAYTATVDAGNVAGYSITGLTNGTTYYFVVAAYNSGGESPNSNEVSSTPVAPAPQAPALSAPTAGNRTITLTWNAVANAVSYKVKFGTTSASYTVAIDVGSETEYQLSDLTNNTAYFIVVVAISAAGESPNSNEVSATPGSQILPEEPAEYITNVDYNAMGQMTKVQFGNGLITEYTYHPLNFRLMKIKTTNPSQEVIQELSYSYDSVGNILSITDGVRTASQTFQYDALNRLSQASGNYGVKNYSYDEIGNILSKDGLTYTYGEGEAGVHAVTSMSDGTVFQYDTNGNITKKTNGSLIWDYSYDAENRLKEAKKNSQTAAKFEYDGDGGRTKKIAYNTNQLNTTNRVKNLFDLSKFASYDRLPTAKESGELSSLIAKTTKFVGSLYEEDDTSQTRHIFLGDTRIASVTNGRTHYYLSDHLGGTNLVTDNTGAIKELSEYEPFGGFSRHEKYGDPQATAWFYFTGKQLDDETGLYYYGARYYNPSLGRFITADSITPNPANPQAFNRYSYVYNNPLNFTDPSGNFPWLAAIIGALIGGASSGIQSYQATGQVNFLNIGIGMVTGALSGAALGTPFSSIKEQGYWWGLARASGGFSLAGQVAGAAGWQDGQKALNYAAIGTGALYMGANVAKGIKDWAYENRFDTYDAVFEEPAYVQSGQSVHVNGILTDTPNALNEARFFKADILANNPTSGPIADLTEALLDKVAFTSSVSRQLGQSLSGLSNISLSGFSQGGMIASNTALQLGLLNQRSVISHLNVASSQISQVRVLLSGAAAGLPRAQITYGAGSVFDFSNFLGPNMNPKYFAGGAIGAGIFPVGASHHYYPNLN